MAEVKVQTWVYRDTYDLPGDAVKVTLEWVDTVCGIRRTVWWLWSDRAPMWRSHEPGTIRSVDW